MTVDHCHCQKRARHACNTCISHMRVFLKAASAGPQTLCAIHAPPVPKRRAVGGERHGKHHAALEAGMHVDRGRGCTSRRSSEGRGSRRGAGRDRRRLGSAALPAPHSNRRCIFSTSSLPHLHTEGCSRWHITSGWKTACITRMATRPEPLPPPPPPSRPSAPSATE